MTMFIDETQLAEAADILHEYLYIQQDYEALARKLDALTEETPVTKYFILFAAGYAFWQEDYNYPRVFQYFYGAYLDARRVGLRLRQNDCDDFFYKFTRAMINYTGCENALICNSPIDFLQRATEAHVYALKARAALIAISSAVLPDALRDPIRNYLEMNIALFKGFQNAGKLYFAPYSAVKDIDRLETETTKHLHGLQSVSTELYSELRAHYSFAQRLRSAYQQRRYTSLRVKQASLLLRAIGYLEPELVRALFKEHENSSGDLDYLIADVARKTQLKVAGVYTIELNDSFNTEAGLQQYLERLIFELPADTLQFRIFDGNRPKDYVFDSITVSITRFGSMSVDFELNINDDPRSDASASVSHLRVLESLLGPHIGWITFNWGDCPPDVSQEQLTRTDFVSYLLRCRDWLDRGAVYIPKEEEIQVSALKQLLEQWEEALLELSFRLPLAWKQTLAETMVFGGFSGAEKVYINLKEILDKIRTHLDQWEWLNTAASTDKEAQFKRQRDELFPREGVVFSRLMNIAQEILHRFRNYGLKIAELEETEPSLDQETQKYLHFDADVGWHSTLICNRIVLKSPDGDELEPFTESELREISQHPEFKGLLLQSREARSAIDDWMFVPVPRSQQNLAHIRSHETDVMVVGNNRAFAYLPDEPEFIVSQYIDTCRLVADLRAYLMGQQVILGNVLRELDETLENLIADPDTKFDPIQPAMIFHKLRQAEQALDLIQVSMLTKYQDHSDLIRAMLDESGVLGLSHLVAKNVERLQNYLNHLNTINRLT